MEARNKIVLHFSIFLISLLPCHNQLNTVEDWFHAIKCSIKLESQERKPSIKPRKVERYIDSKCSLMNFLLRRNHERFYRFRKPKYFSSILYHAHTHYTQENEQN